MKSERRTSLVGDAIGIVFYFNFKFLACYFYRTLNEFGSDEVSAILY